MKNQLIVEFITIDFLNHKITLPYFFSKFDGSFLKTLDLTGRPCNWSYQCKCLRATAKIVDEYNSCSVIGLNWAKFYILMFKFTRILSFSQCLSMVNSILMNHCQYHKTADGNDPLWFKCFFSHWRRDVSPEGAVSRN